MSIGQVLLWSAGVLLAMVLVCGVSVWMDRKFPGESFDERQAMFRGKAAALTLFWGNIYFLYILISGVRSVWPFESAMTKASIFFPFMSSVKGR